MDTGFHFKFTNDDASRLLWGLIFFEICLVLIFAADAVFELPRPLHKLFSLDREVTIPAWFSSSQLFLIGIIFLLSANRSGKHEVVPARFLLLVGIGFIFLSMDEAAEFHENITRTLRHLEWVPQFKGGRGVWIPIYLSIAMILLVTNLRAVVTFWKTYRREALIILSGLLVYLLGAVGMEIVSYLFLRQEASTGLYQTEVAFEEFFEMAGCSVILYGTILFAISDS